MLIVLARLSPWQYSPPRCLIRSSLPLLGAGWGFLPTLLGLGAGPSSDSDVGGVSLDSAPGAYGACVSPKQPADPESAENCAKYVSGVSLFLEFTAARGAGGRSLRKSVVHPGGKTWALPWGGVSPSVGAAGFTGDRAQQAGGPQRRRLVLERADFPWLLRSGLM